MKNDLPKTAAALAQIRDGLTPAQIARIDDELKVAVLKLGASLLSNRMSRAEGNLRKRWKPKPPA
jgi:hypothetical protein